MKERKREIITLMLVKKEEIRERRAIARIQTGFAYEFAFLNKIKKFEQLFL